MTTFTLRAVVIAMAVASTFCAPDAHAAGHRHRASHRDAAYEAATAAYKAFEQRDFAAAVERAQEAVRLAPKREDYRKLLANARAAVQSSQAQAAGAAMYKALDAGDLAAAIAQGEAAIRFAPEHPAYRLALVHAYLRAKRFAEAEKHASEALALLPDSAAPLALRAYARDRLGHREEAAADLQRALAQRQLGEGDARQLRTMLADVRSAHDNGPPSIDCGQVERTQTCAVTAATAAAAPAQPGFEAASAAYAAMEARDYPRALALAREATAANSEQRDWQLLQMQAAAEAGQFDESDRIAAALQAEQGLAPQQQVQLAYYWNRRGDNRRAESFFAQAQAAGALPPTSLLDAGYAAMHAKRDAEAVTYFRGAVDAADSLQLRMEPQMLYDTRRAISELTRKWGVLASVIYRPGGGAVPGFGTSGASGRRVLQAGAEAYWRPWGFRNGEFVELFARGFQTLHSEGGGATGSDSFEGALGVRWKPISTQNAVLSLARVFGTQIDSEWLVQAAYSVDRGTDLRVDVPSWWTNRFYLEAGRYFGRDLTYAVGSVQVGKSFRAADSNTVLYPHMVLAAEYDSTAAERTAVGAGPGLGVRHWFREDKYHAPRSYVDLTMQYRAKLAGDDRAKGLFITTQLSY